MDNYDISSIKPVDNSVISWVYETFFDHYAWHISILKLYGLSSTNPYVWIKPGYSNLWLSGMSGYGAIGFISYTRDYDRLFTFPEFSDMM